MNDKQLAAAGRALKRARQTQQDKYEACLAAVVAYVNAGGSESDAARLAGIDRMTVRKALGKR